MNNKKENRTFGNFINLLYPAVVAGLFLFVDVYCKLTYQVRGFENVLESIITFTSIVIGFYTAMYGVLITLTNSKLMLEFKKRKLDSIFRIQLYDSLIISFLVLVLSIIMQVLYNYPNHITDLFFDMWFTFIGYFVATSYRAISLLLKILFSKEERSPKAEQKSSDEKKNQMEKINQNDSKINHE
ncbi:MAG TPA: hypothetical protein K8V00_07425 [Ligilactobacillus acidipiscis]|uniref:Uncharacterized protein n=1 Tax=Ligilactobacillus acidipiscis TaxID=89059 RepID=A0A921FB07_9LACO|nr:hypothetical protein [Ligilactobacillus acidipiscis]